MEYLKIISKMVLIFWFLGIPMLAAMVAAFMLAVGVLGAPIWLFMWLVLP